MKILIVSLGSIGRRHIKNIKLIKSDAQLALFRQHSKESDIGEVKTFVDKLFFERNEASSWKPDVTFVTNPAPLHIETALNFARQGSHLFIEKPLSDTLDNIDVLLKECAQRNLVLMVGYVLHFLEPLKVLKQVIKDGRIGRILSIHAAVGQYLPDWRPQSDYSKTVSARKELGGGVVFELSHEIDYVRWLAGEVVTVNAKIAKTSNLRINVEDVAEIILQFDSGTIGSVHLDMVDRAAYRLCRVVGTDGTLTWDTSNGRHNIRLYSADKQEWTNLLSINFLDNNEIYLAELRHFFDCIDQKKEPIVNGVDAKRMVEIALAVKRASEKGRVVSL